MPESTHPAVHNPLLEAPPEGVPAVDELEATLAELGVMKARSVERVRKAAGDLKVIEGEMRRMKEREKGKGKAGTGAGGMGAPGMEKGKVKREQSCASSLFFTLSVYLLMTSVHLAIMLCVVGVSVVRNH